MRFCLVIASFLLAASRIVADVAQPVVQVDAQVVDAKRHLNLVAIDGAVASTYSLATAEANATKINNFLADNKHFPRKRLLFPGERFAVADQDGDGVDILWPQKLGGTIEFPGLSNRITHSTSGESIGDSGWEDYAGGFVHVRRTAAPANTPDGIVMRMPSRGCRFYGTIAGGHYSTQAASDAAYGTYGVNTLAKYGIEIVAGPADGSGNVLNSSKSIMSASVNLCDTGIAYSGAVVETHADHTLWLYLEFRRCHRLYWINNSQSMDHEVLFSSNSGPLTVGYDIEDGGDLHVTRAFAVRGTLLSIGSGAATASGDFGFERVRCDATTTEDSKFRLLENKDNGSRMRIRMGGHVGNLGIHPYGDITGYPFDVAITAAEMPSPKGTNAAHNNGSSTSKVYTLTNTPDLSAVVPELDSLFLDLSGGVRWVQQITAVDDVADTVTVRLDPQAVAAGSAVSYAIAPRAQRQLARCKQPLLADVQMNFNFWGSESVAYPVRSVRGAPFASPYAAPRPTANTILWINSESRAVKQATGGVIGYGTGTLTITADVAGLADGAEGNQLATVTLAFSGTAGATYTATTNTLAVTVTTADGATDVTDIATAINAGSDFTATAGANPLVNQTAGTSATVLSVLSGGAGHSAWHVDGSANVQQAADLSGQGNHLATSTSPSSTAPALAAQKLNFRDAMQFTSDSLRRAHASVAGFTSIGDLSIDLVFVPTTPFSTDHKVLLGKQSGTTGFYLHQKDLTNQIAFSFYVAGVFQRIVADHADQVLQQDYPYLIRVRRNATTGEVILIVNGTWKRAVLATGNIDNSTGDLILGAQSDGAVSQNNPFHGYYGEVKVDKALLPLNDSTDTDSLWHLRRWGAF